MSVTVLIAGWFTFIGIKSLGNQIEEEKLQIVFKDYKSLHPPSMSELEDITWEAPPAQDSEGFWLYEVFTPPKIYLDNGKWDAKPPVPPKPKEPEKVPNPLPPFGLEFKSIYRPPFRVIIDSVIFGGQDPTKSFVQLQYLNISPPVAGMTQASILSRKPLRGTVGKNGIYFREEKIRILNVKPEKITRNNLPTTVYKVQIQDFSAINPATGDVYSFELMPDKKMVSGPDFFVTLVSSQDPSVQPIFLKNPKPGDRFAVKEDRFIIEKVTEAPPSITLKKLFQYREFDDQPFEEREEIKTLSIAPLAPATPVPSPSPMPTPGTLPSPTPSLPPPAGSLPIPGAVPIPSPAPTPGMVPSPASSLPPPAGTLPIPGSTPAGLPVPAPTPAPATSQPPAPGPSSALPIPR